MGCCESCQIDENEWTDEGNTALSYAQDFNHSEVVEKFTAAGANDEEEEEEDSATKSRKKRVRTETVNQADLEVAAAMAVLDDELSEEEREVQEGATLARDLEEFEEDGLGLARLQPELMMQMSEFLSVKDSLVLQAAFVTAAQQAFGCLVSGRLGHEAQAPDPTNRVKAYNLVGGMYFCNATGSVFDGWIECWFAYTDLTRWCQRLHARVEVNPEGRKLQERTRRLHRRLSCLQVVKARREEPLRFAARGEQRE